MGRISGIGLASLAMVLAMGITGCERRPTGPPSPSPSPTPSASPSDGPGRPPAEGLGVIPLAVLEGSCRAGAGKTPKVRGERGNGVGWLVDNRCTQPHQAADGQHPGTDAARTHDVAFRLKYFHQDGEADCRLDAEYPAGAAPASQKGPGVSGGSGSLSCVRSDVCARRRVAVGDGRQKLLVCPVPGNACRGCYGYDVTVDGVVSDPEIVIWR